MFGLAVEKIIVTYKGGEHFIDLEGLLNEAAPGWGPYEEAFGDHSLGMAIRIVETFLDQLEHGMDFEVPTKDLEPLLPIIARTFREGRAINNEEVEYIWRRLVGEKAV